MKPKERFYGYALLPTNCDRNTSVIKDDIPIDLSTKKQHSPSIVHSISSFASSDYETHSIDPTLGYNDWSTKFLLSSGAARNVQIQTNPNLLPYLLLNRNCLDVNSPVKDATIASKSPKTDIIYDQFGNPYRVGADHSLITVRSPYFDLYKNNAFSRTAQNGSHISSPPNMSSSNSSSPSTNLTNNSHEYNETKRLLERSPTNSSLSATPEAMKTNRSHNHLSDKNNGSQHLTRSRSYPSIFSALKSKDKNESNENNLQKSNGSRYLSKSKSESSLHFITFERYERKVSYKPKSLAIFRYSNGENIERIAEKIRKNQQKLDYKHCLKLNESQHTLDSDIEKEDIIESGVSDDYGSDDALDLRVSQSLPTKFRPDLSNSDPEHLFHQINNFLNQSPPAANPLDVYRQYYYYLMNQPALASRAVAAVAVAETYAKLLSGAHHNHHNDRNDDHNSIDICDTNTSIYESENQSPDYLLNGSRTELRSADTTNNGIPFDRKRISRPLTGKHVRHGTGASPSTLVSLRNMIQQRQRLKEIGALDTNKYGKGKTGKRVKRK